MKYKSSLQKIKNDSQKNTFEKDPKKSLKEYLLKGLLFIFCAIPGLFLFLFLSLWVAVYIFTPDIKNPPLLLTPLLMAIGIVLMLIGTGKLKEFKYIAVFLFIPISLIIFGYLSERRIMGRDSIAIALFVGLTLLFINYLIKLHYQNRRKEDETNERQETRKEKDR